MPHSGVPDADYQESRKTKTCLAKSNLATGCQFALPLIDSPCAAESVAFHHTLSQNDTFPFEPCTLQCFTDELIYSRTPKNHEIDDLGEENET